MAGAVLRAGAWPAVAGITGVAVVTGGCGAAFPAAATVLLPVCFTLLAAAAAFTLDEPASAVVDVTPTGPARRTRIRAVALLAPLAAGVLVLLAPSVVPQVARWVRTFPAPGAGGPSSDTVWWTVLAVCAVAIAVSIGGRNLPRWMSSVP
jgi:hypothetical protein